MKVLHIMRGLLKSGGGPSYTVPALAMSQARMGAEVSMLLEKDEFEYESLAGVNVTRLCEVQGSMADYFRGFDIIHDNGAWLPWNHRVALAAKKAGVPRMISPRGALQEWIWNQRRWKKELGWFLYQKNDLYTAAGILATASIEGDRVRRLGYNGPIFEIPNGVDAMGAWSERSGVGPFHALFLSRIHPKKGIEELVDAWIKIAPKSWVLDVAGPDEVGLVPMLKEKARRAGVDIRFLGMLEGPDKSAAFQCAELFLLPTHSENFGVTVIEAMLMGLPVITTTGTPWLDIEKNGHGWLIDPGLDPLFKALDVVLNLPIEVLRQKGRAACEWANGRYTWDKVGSDSLVAYNEILRQKGR